MSHRTSQPIWSLKFSVPVFVVVLTLRALYLNGTLARTAEAIGIAITDVLWFLAGGIPSSEYSLFILMGVTYFSMYWLILVPHRPRILQRGRPRRREESPSGARRSYSQTSGRRHRFRSS